MIKGDVAELVCEQHGELGVVRYERERAAVHDDEPRQCVGIHAIARGHDDEWRIQLCSLRERQEQPLDARPACVTLLSCPKAHVDGLDIRTTPVSRTGKSCDGRIE